MTTIPTRRPHIDGRSGKRMPQVAIATLAWSIHGTARSLSNAQELSGESRKSARLRSKTDAGRTFLMSVKNLGYTFRFHRRTMDEPRPSLILHVRPRRLLLKQHPITSKVKAIPRRAREIRAPKMAAHIVLSRTMWALQ